MARDFLGDSGKIDDTEFGSDVFASVATNKKRVIPSWITPFRVLVSLAIVGSGVYAYGHASGAKSTYRTAIATLGSTSQTIDSVATITPSSQAVVDFATAGTVASVPVTIGQEVATGDVLATLDTSSLNATLQSDNLILANDQLKLYNDLASQTTTTTSPPTTVAQVSSITQLQSQISAAETTLSSALAQANSLCSSPASSTATTQSTTAQSSATQQTTTQSTAGNVASRGASSQPPSASSTSTSATTTVSTTCAGAIAGASSASSQVSTLIASLNKAVAVSSSNSTSVQSNGVSSNTARGSTTSLRPATETQIQVDNANIALAEANLQETESTIGFATLKAPISGTVVSIGVTPGSTVNGTSNTSQFVVVGSGSDYSATFSVTPSQLPLLHLDQRATVLPDLSKSPVVGSISAIGAVSNSSSSPTYPVTVTFSDANLDHFSGDQAEVSISVATADNAVVVPTSAITTNGGSRYVTELSGNSTKKISVSVGVVGSIYTQITSGLSAGQEVVLADNSLAIPATSSLTTRFGGLGGGLGGGSGRALRNSLG